MVDLFPEGFEEADAAGEVELAAYARTVPAGRLAEFGPVTAEAVAPGWRHGWKRFHRPVRVGPLWIGPPWKYADDGAIAVVIDPGQAFGTGSHPTTQLCLELLRACGPGVLADLGCGSGVLSIAAAKLGFASIVALDSDSAAVEATLANAAANGVEIDARESDVTADVLPRTDIAVANIALRVVEDVAERVSAPLLITSGYLASERPAARTRRHRERRELDGWAADLFAAD
jgi:ribosomal protein L11 methyltransferase